MHFTKTKKASTFQRRKKDFEKKCQNTNFFKWFALATFLSTFTWLLPNLLAKFNLSLQILPDKPELYFKLVFLGS